MKLPDRCAETRRRNIFMPPGGLGGAAHIEAMNTVQRIACVVRAQEGKTPLPTSHCFVILFVNVISIVRLSSLLRRMLKAGISRYEPDPMAALERTKQQKP